MMDTIIPQSVVNALAASVPADCAGTGEPVYIGAGRDVAVFRWGDRALRFPTRRDAVELIDNEYRWVPDATAPLDEVGIPVPTPRFRGKSCDIFEYPWLVVDYIEGTELINVPLEERGAIARDLAAGFAALHRPAPAVAPSNPFRSVPLSAKAERFEARVPGLPKEELMRRLFSAGLDAGGWEEALVWCHGDPHPANLISAEGRLVGIIDFGDIGRGDPAVDYTAFYLAFTEEQRADARRTLRDLGAADGEDLWARARAWAAYVTASFLFSDKDDLRAMGAHAVTLLSED